MRRHGNLWPRITSYASLLRATREASRGKRQARSVAPFLERREYEVLQLARELIDESWRPSLVFRFEVFDPKRRAITVAPFRDQVVHHALMAEVAPLFERRMIDQSYACRRGKGQHAAVRQAQTMMRRYAWFLKLDVRSFFGTVRHDIALSRAARVVKDPKVLRLFATILRGPEAESATGVGLPLGSLTSQWLANLLLDAVDHRVKEKLRIPGYVRYMDDFVLFGNDRHRLHEAQHDLGSFLARALQLTLKPRATMLAPTRVGLPFLGWSIHRGTIRVRPENLRRYRWRWRLRRFEFERGVRSEESYRDCVAALFELLRQGDTAELRRGWVARHRLEI